MNQQKTITKNEIIRRVNELMVKTFELEQAELLPSAKLYEDLGLDSLDAVDMLVHLESTLGIKVSGEKFVNVRTLEDIYNVMFEVTQQNAGKLGDNQIEAQISTASASSSPQHTDIAE